MQPDESVHQFLNEVLKLLHAIDTKEMKSPEEWPKEILADLARLEGYSKLMHEMNEKTISRLSKDKAKESLSELSHKDRQLLSKFETLRNEIKQRRAEISAQAQLIKTGLEVAKKPKTRVSRSRKKKFRPLGGQEDWKRM